MPNANPKGVETLSSEKKSIENIRMFSTLRDSWTANEFATGLDKVKWIDVPSNIGKFLTGINVEHRIIKPANVARHIHKSSDVSTLKEVMKWFAENLDRTFTYYYDSSTYSARWRMTAKPFQYKKTNYYAKGLASTIQSNQFWIRDDMFDNAYMLNSGNPTWMSWRDSVIKMLPQLKLDEATANDKAIVNNAKDMSTEMLEHSMLMRKKMNDMTDDIKFQINRLIDSSLDSYRYSIKQLMHADDMLEHMNENILVSTDGLIFEESKQSVAASNRLIKEHTQKLFANKLTLMDMRERYLALFDTKDGEEE